jgi:hypothetical protein
MQSRGTRPLRLKKLCFKHPSLGYIGANDETPRRIIHIQSYGFEA